MHVGISAARNEAMRLAKGDVFFILDDDDTIELTCVEEELALLQDNDLVFCELLAVRGEQRKPLGMRVQTFAQCYQDKMMPHGSSMFRRSLVEGHWYDETLQSAVDYDFLLRLMWKNPGLRIAMVDQTLYQYHFHGQKEEKSLRQVEAARAIKKYWRMADVTAVIKTFLRDDYLFQAVNSLREYAPGIQMIVADDGHCTDEKERRLHELGIRYLRLPFNSCSITQGRNLILQQVETPYALIGDDDFRYVPETKLTDMLSMMDIADLAAGAVMQGGIVGHYECLFQRTPKGISDLPLPPWQRHEGVRYAPANLVFNFFVAKTEALRRVRWDERIHASYEHEDFFLSAQASGLKVVYCPESIVLHRGGYHKSEPDSAEYTQYRYQGRAQDKAVFESKWGPIYSMPNTGISGL
jgi:GT2 family glycosyltransferase